MIGYSAATIENEARRIYKRFKDDHRSGYKIEMIKELRTRLSGLGLMEAKNAIEAAMYNYQSDTAPTLGDILNTAIKQAKQPVDRFFVIVDGQFYTAETEAEAKRVRSFLYTILDTNKIVTIIRGDIV